MRIRNLELIVYIVSIASFAPFLWCVRGKGMSVDGFFFLLVGCMPTVLNQWNNHLWHLLFLESEAKKHRLGSVVTSA